MERSMRLSHLFALSAVSALVLSSTGAQAQHYRHHHGGNGAAVGAAIGAGVFLGALAASSARDRDVYIEDAPPPPPRRVYRSYEGPTEGPREAIAACRTGLLDAARQYGAYDAEIGEVYSVRETPNGHLVRAEITIDYPRDRRTSDVACETEDGILVSARNEN
jgi:hypothetical protein